MQKGSGAADIHRTISLWRKVVCGCTMRSVQQMFGIGGGTDYFEFAGIS